MVALAVLCRVVLCVQQRCSGDIGQECLQLGGRIWEGLIDGGKGVIVIAVLLASASLSVTVLSASRPGVKFSNFCLASAGIISSAYR
jgi:TRAP-type uncharacterized transport system fused permease subunit